MKSSQFLKKIADLEEKSQKLFNDLPNPIYGFMTRKNWGRFAICSAWRRLKI